MPSPARQREAKPPRRVGDEASATRARLLDITETLMRGEGYASVSTRRVAKEAGLTPALVHYYFPSTDDLLLATYKRANARNLEQLEAALAAPDPARRLWQLNTDSLRTGLWVEFMALANHRKSIQSAIAEYAIFARQLQARILAKTLRQAKISPKTCSPAAFSTLLAGLARVLVMEENLGILAGHDDLRATVELLLRKLEPTPKTPPRPRRPALTATPLPEQTFSKRRRQAAPKTREETGT